jgi:hypothetical protein
VWGDHTLNELEQVINAVYEEVVYWRKNIFFIAKWSCGKKLHPGDDKTNKLLEQ